MQTSETLKIGVTLAVSGGFMDAYSYICRDEVFANAQTGNILLFGISVFEQNWPMCVNHIVPVVLFALGVVATDQIKWKFQSFSKIHWRQLIVLAQMIIFIIVGFMPQSYNLLANSITSFACGMQVEAFRKINGNVAATTMCIGNLRSGTENLGKYFQTKNKEMLKKALLYFCVIVFFTLGAIIGNFFVGLLREKAIIVCSLFMITIFLMMFKEEAN